MTRPPSGLPAKVAQQLLQRIVAKEFAPGSVLPSEREIQETYSVSRPVAREAIKLLAARGIITVYPRQGAMVGTDLTGAASDALILAFQHENVVQEDLLHARMVLEPHIVALAAQQATIMQLRRLQQMRQPLDQMLAVGKEELADRSFGYWGFDDAQFHVLLAEMSQNPAFKILIEVLVGILWKQRNHLVPMTAEHSYNAAAQHVAIIEAVVAHDPEEARRCMIAHLEYTHRHIMSQPNELQNPVQMQLE
jgi:GntR family transcriptional regulator, transcriptional repressor for pyruvate dehydrogenase complex